MARRSLDDIRSIFKQEDDARSKQGGFGDYYPFWQMAVGKQAIIRFLPDANDQNPYGFLKEKAVHKLIINGEEKTIPCLSMWGDDCPICKVSQSFYKNNDTVQGKQYWRKKQHLARVIVIDDPLPANDDGETNQGKVMNLSLNYSLYNLIKESFKSDDLDGRPDDYENGTDFIIKKSQQGEYASYVLSKFARRSSALTPDQVELADESLVDLASLLPAKPSLEKVESMLEAALTGAAYDDSGTGASAIASSPSTATTAAATTTTVDDEDDEDDPEVILAALRNRNKKNAA